MTVQINNNPYNKVQDAEYGQNYDILHIELWQGESLPKNYTWYGLGQIAQRSEYPELYAMAEKFGFITTEEEWQAGQYGKFSSGDGKSTFRFPLIREGDVLTFTGEASKCGIKIEPELPNATGAITSYIGYTASGSDKALISVIGINANVAGGKGVCTSNNINLDLSKSNSIYKNGGSVRQSGIAARLIIKYK